MACVIWGELKLVAVSGANGQLNANNSFTKCPRSNSGTVKGKPSEGLDTAGM